jgi:hypothetical protein
MRAVLKSVSDISQMFFDDHSVPPLISIYTHYPAKMKISNVVAAALALVLHVPSMVQADRLVRFLFNDGKNDTDAGSCNMLDDILVDGIITLSGYNFTYSRKLRASSYPTRNLQYYPPKCKRVCEGFADGTCRATDCVGYRRVLMETIQDDRELGSGKSFSCDTQVDFINRELDKLVNNSLVSSSCQKLLSKHRKWDCYDDVIYGVVERMVLWQVKPTQAIVDSKYSGQDICKNTRVDFEPITNTCVDFLFSTVTGPNDFYKNSTRSDFHPSSATKTVFGGESGILFPYVGAYTIKSVPDGFQSKALTISFNVVSSSVEAVRLWNTTTNTIIDANFNGGNICRNKRFNLEVVAGSCVTTMRGELAGPFGKPIVGTDSSRPFSLFGETNGKLNGKSLSTLGAYNLTIYPYPETTDEMKVISFYVVDC